MEEVEVLPDAGHRPVAAIVHPDPVCSSGQLRVGPGCDDRLGYGGFNLDIDGNNLEAVCQRPE
jgi:hypothetical protein